MSKKNNIIETILVIAILILTFLLIYSPHFDYRYPFHVDEWKHIEEAKKISLEEFTHKDNKLEFFFDMGLYFLSRFTPLINIYHILPAIFWTLNAFLLFILLRKLIPDYAAILCLLFFMTIRSNVNILGPIFFTPIQASFFLIFIFLILLVSATKDPNYLTILNIILVSIITFLFYPPSAIIEFSIFLFYIHRLWKLKNFPYFLGLTIISFSAFIIIFIYKITEHSFLDTVMWLTRYLFFEAGWGIYEVKFDFILLYGLLPFSFAVCGIYYVIKKRLDKIFLILPIYPALMLLCYSLFNFTVLIPYQRDLFYLQVFLTPLSGIGLYFLLKDLLNFHKKQKIMAMIGVVLLVSIIVVNMMNFYTYPPQYKLYRLVDKDDMKAIDFLKDITPSKMIAPLELSLPIKVMTKHQIIATTYYYGTSEEKNLVHSFFSGDCKEQETIIKTHDIDLIYSTKEFLCDYKRIYDSNKIKIYTTD